LYLCWNLTQEFDKLRDNASPLASDYCAALDLPATRYILQITQASKATSQKREAA